MPDTFDNKKYDEKLPKRNKDPRSFYPRLSKLTTASHSTFHEDWEGGDFLIKVGDKIKVIEKIKLIKDKKEEVIEKGDIIKIDNIKSKHFEVTIKGKKHKILKDKFYEIADRLEKQ